MTDRVINGILVPGHIPDYAAASYVAAAKKQTTQQVADTYAASNATNKRVEAEQAVVNADIAKKAAAKAAAAGKSNQSTIIYGVLLVAVLFVGYKIIKKK